MAVSEQTPYKEYTANGSTNSFALEFDCENQDHLIVLVDDVEPVVGTWSLSDGSVVFGTAPTTGKKITIQRNTPFRRDGDFQSYDNSFRPPGVNKGFDKIWLKLQELGVADWILSNRINDLRAYVDKQDNVLQDNIDSLKNYVDDKDDELRNYLLNAIQEQGVALDQLEEYYSYLMQQLTQVAIDRGWAASFIVSADGSTQQEINDFGGAKWRNKPLGYDIGSTVKLASGDIVKSTVANNIINPNVDMTGWVDNKQPKNSLLSYGFSHSESIHLIIQNLANSLNDGDELIIPPRPDGGAWHWDGQAVITKQINIECLGTINAKFRDSSPHIIFRSDVDYTYNAADLLNSFQKGQNKLALKTLFTAANLSDFFCVLTSTEVAIHRAGFTEDYTKNIVLDIVGDDGALRDALPFGLTDLTKATLRFVKKKNTVIHDGLVIKNTDTDATSLRGMNIKYEYCSNITTKNSMVDQGSNGEFGTSFLINNCFNLNFESTWSKAKRNNSSSLYNFLIANAGYCSFHKCGNISVGSQGILRGIEGRHGYKTTVDDCLVNGVDDHWGYDITVKNCHLPLGVGISGGSVTIENVAANIVFSQRQDTPYNDGTLTIKNCKPYSSIARLLGHEDLIWTSKDYTKRKCFDVINIDGITAIASDMIQSRNSADAMLFLVRDPQLDETQVFRDTVLNMSNITVINDVVGLSQINAIVGWNENNATPLKNYDKKQMFTSINLKNVKVFFKNGATPSDSGIPPVSGILTLKDCQNLEFYRYRARYVNICGGSVLNVGTYNRFYDCELLNINGVNLSECTSKLIYANKTDRYYQNTLVNIYNSNLPSQSYGYDGFTSYAATAQGITLKSAFGNTYKVYDLKDNSIIDNFYLTDLRAYNADRNLRYKFASELIVAANTESAILSADFPSVRSFDYVVGNFDVNNNLQIITVPPASYGVALNKVYFKVKNTSASPITIAANTGVNFRII